MAENKVNIDKEMMYKRIMPSSFKKESISEDDLYNPELFNDDKDPRISTAISGVHHKNTAKQKQDVDIINIMQIIIDKRLDMAFTKFNCCRCDRCRKDVTAYALNLLGSKYIVAKDVDIEKYEKEMNVLELNTAIIKAILKVRDNTRH